MLETLAYLQDPELVARFQRQCGLFLFEAAHHSRGRTHASTGTLPHADKPHGQLKAKWAQQDKNSNIKHKANGYALSVSHVLLLISAFDLTGHLKLKMETKTGTKLT